VTTTATALPSIPAKIHFVGIGGIGMSGLARILRNRGYDVSGSDAFPSTLTDQLQTEGIEIQAGHDETERATTAALVVATAALRQTNPELLAARAANVPIIKRAELLGMLMNARDGIAVAGSHGKSSTSGMLVSAMRDLGRDPSYAVGAVVHSTGTNASPGSGSEMVVEADEYDYSFLWLKPKIAIILNIDFDHPDLFSDQATYDRAFVRFARGIVPGGTLIVNGDDAGVRRVQADLAAGPGKITSYGWGDDVDWRISGNEVTSADGQSVGIDLQVPGQHQVGNATAALIALSVLGVQPAAAAASLAAFSGIARRFEIKAEIDGITIVDDYAHHPEEVAATLAAARSRYPDRRIVAAFQPHTYSRTRALAGQFASSLALADLAIVLDIYPARETDSLGVSAATILDQIPGPHALHAGKPADAATLLAELARPGDVILTMGAGDITLAGPMLADLIDQRHHA